MTATATPFKPSHVDTLQYEQFCEALRREFSRFRRWWKIDKPFDGAQFFLECLETPRGVLIVQVFPDGAFYPYAADCRHKTLKGLIEWALTRAKR